MITNEKQSRANILAIARENGFESALLSIFNRYDNALKGCKTKEERDAVSTMGVLEIDKLFNGRVLLSVKK